MNHQGFGCVLMLPLIALFLFSVLLAVWDASGQSWSSFAYAITTGSLIVASVVAFVLGLMCLTSE
jgi:hypothetical protein